MEKRRLENSPKHRKQGMLQMTNLSHCGKNSRKVMVYHSMMVIVNENHIQRKLNISKTCIMVIGFPNLFFIIKKHNHVI
jgi:hypothetical protein